MTSYKNCCKQFKVFNQSFSVILKFVKHLRQEIVIVNITTGINDEQLCIADGKLHWNLVISDSNFHSLIDSKDRQRTFRMGCSKWAFPNFCVSNQILLKHCLTKMPSLLTQSENKLFHCKPYSLVFHTCMRVFNSQRSIHLDF